MAPTPITTSRMLASPWAIPKRSRRNTTAKVRSPEKKK